MPIIHIASDEKYWQKLQGKLKEEVDEFIQGEKALLSRNLYDSSFGRAKRIIELIKSRYSKGFVSHSLVLLEEVKESVKAENFNSKEKGD